MKERLYIITGADGHLASTIIQYLKKGNCPIRGLILPQEENKDCGNVTYYKGDVTEPETMKSLFSGIESYEVIVIHAAGIVSISSEVTPELYNVNVNGTKNIIALCRQYAVKRLVYVSSVHAISEKEPLRIVRESSIFDKEKVEGAYAKTKAEATQLIMEAVQQGLDAVVVHPSGIIGPFDKKQNNHLTQLIQSYISGKLIAGVTGGYDFVDVRDVALGCIAAAHKGRAGECYILSNRYISVKDLLEYMRIIVHGRRKICLPMGLVKLLAPMIEAIGRVRKTRPLFTKYSLYTMESGGRFSHDKATRELGYSPRDMMDTIRDTILYLQRTKCCRN